MTIEIIPRSEAFNYIRKRTTENKSSKKYSLETKRVFKNGIPFEVYNEVPDNMCVDLADKGDKVQVAGENSNFFFEEVIADGSVMLYDKLKKKSYWEPEAVALTKPKPKHIE